MPLSLHNQVNLKQQFMQEYWQPISNNRLLLQRKLKLRHMLLLQRVRVDFADKQGLTAIHLAAASNDPDAQRIFKLLIESGPGSNVSLLDKKGENAAHMAAASDNVEVLMMIHDLDSSLIFAVDGRGGSTLHHACLTGAIHALEWLLEQVRRE